MRRSRGERLFDIGNVALLTLLGLATIYPFMHTLTLSLSTPQSSAQFGLRLVPTELSFEAYREIVADGQVFVAYRNTLVRTVGGTLLIIIATITVAYPLSRREFPARGFITFLFVFSLLFDGGLVPRYLLVKNLGLINSLWALILPVTVSGYFVIILRNFFQSIHEELIDSARIDGASELRILTQVVLPLATPALAVLALWAAVDHWNAWFDAVLYTIDASKEVLQLFLRRTVLEDTNHLLVLTRDSRFFTPESLKAAVLMFVSLPILVVYPFIQRYFVTGIMLGSVKG